MRRLKAILIVTVVFLMLFPGLVYAKTKIVGGWKLVASGSIAAGDNKLDYTSTNAYIEFGVDISPYHGNHKIVVTDLAGKVATGYISATAPGGETYAATLATNGDNEAAVFNGPAPNSGIQRATMVQSAEQAQAGTSSAKITANAESSYHYYLFSGLTQYAVHYASIYVYNPSDQNVPSVSLCGNDGSGISTLDSTTTKDAWVNLTGYHVPDLAVASVRFFHLALYNGSVSGKYWYTDTVVVQRLTDCAATGALIVSALGGSTRSWTSVDAGFNPNLACTYKIYRVR